MRGFGIHTSMWASDWTRANAELAIAEAKKWPIDFVEIPLLQPHAVDAAHSRGLPQECWASHSPDKAVEFLTVAVDRCAEMGAEALCGVTYGGIGERSGFPPTEAELDNVARALSRIAAYAKGKGVRFGIEAINRYESHLINTGWQAVAMVERVGSDNLFVHLDTYHMNIEEKGVANGILDAREHLAYIHLSESDRGTPGEGTCGWNEIFAALAAIGFKGGMAMESFIALPPTLAYGLSVWRPVAESAQEVMGKGLPFLRNMARQYKLV
jgi:D-psicose/D-tagatose/L-ribulose 3-epimerase